MKGMVIHMTKKHSSKKVKQSIPQCYEPLWNLWHTGRLLWQGDSCILYELTAEGKDTQCLLLFPMETLFLEQIKIFSCQQDLGFSPLKAYTIFEDCICLRLTAITPVSLRTNEIATNGLQFFFFIKNTLSLLFRLAGQGIWLSGFSMDDIAFLPDGTPILFSFHRSAAYDSNCYPLQDLCKLLYAFCRKTYPSCLVYLEQLFRQCGVFDIYSDADVHLPPNALLELYSLLIEATENLYRESECELAAIPGTMETQLSSSPSTYRLSSPSTELQASERHIRRRRICAAASLLLLITCLCIAFVFYPANRQSYTSGNVQTTFHASLTSKTASAPSAVPAPASGYTPGSKPGNTLAPGSKSGNTPVPTSMPEPIQYLDLHGKALHILPKPDTPASVLTLDCSSNALTTLAELPEYTGVQELYANNNQIVELDAICTQKNIRVLLLQNNRLRDIMPLQDLCLLEHLDISGNPSLQDITVLLHMPSLQFVNLMDTNVSEKDMKKLRKALPNCHILPETF